MYALGLDIGTTTISAIVSSAQGETKKTITVENGAFIKSELGYEKIQSVNLILQKALKIVSDLVSEYNCIKSIGVTGQMHGFLYVDKNGDAVSPLYTWQDERGLEIQKNGKSYCDSIKEITGYTVYSGYAFATHYFNILNGNMPANATSFCTIQDYVVMKLAGLKKPIMHSSNGASFGLYDLKNNQFDVKAIKKIGVNQEFLPQIVTQAKIVGHYKNLPVAVAIGDNQASFLGAVSKVDEGLLLNVGTGSQISVTANYCENLQKCELRPFIGDKYLIVGCALCGGRAYALLEKFFSDYLKVACGKEINQYELMEALARDCTGEELTVKTTFSGTRNAPLTKGSITEISTENFTAGNLVRGVLKGIIQELYEFSADFYNLSQKTVFVGSGNGLRKNALLCQMANERFNMQMQFPPLCEEASFGALKFSLMATQNT